MSSNQEVRHQQPRRRGPMGRGMQPGEKPKDLKKSIKQLMQYIGKYKIGIFIVMIWHRKYRFYKNWNHPVVCIGVVSVQCIVQLYSGLDHDRCDPESMLSAAKRNFRENQSHADEVF